MAPDLRGNPSGSLLQLPARLSFRVEIKLPDPANVNQPVPTGGIDGSVEQTGRVRKSCPGISSYFIQHEYPS
jgi:hypothetical protein